MGIFQSTVSQSNTPTEDTTENADQIKRQTAFKYLPSDDVKNSFESIEQEIVHEVLDDTIEQLVHDESVKEVVDEVTIVSSSLLKHLKLQKLGPFIPHPKVIQKPPAPRSVQRKFTFTNKVEKK